MRIKILNLFCLNYASVYLMLNAVNETRMKLIDYKSIALPAELQGHILDKCVIKKVFNLFNTSRCNKKLYL